MGAPALSCAAGLACWLFSLARPENLVAAFSSLRRRAAGRELLEMRQPLSGPAGPAPPGAVEGFRPGMESACVGLLNRVASLGHWTVARFRREILATVAGPGDVFVARREGDIAGMAVLHAGGADGGAEIGYIAVHPRHRGRGLGRLLVAQAVAAARARGAPFVFLRTDAFRIPAVRTYLAAGFVPAPRDAGERARWEGVLGRLRGGGRGSVALR